MDWECRAALVLLVAMCLLGLWGWQRATRRGRSRPLRRSRAWRPRSPDDCPCCRVDGARCHPPGADSRCVRPWREGMTRRGRPGRINTQGYACPCPSCAHDGITDSAIHALVGNGHHGTRAPIQNVRSQACGTQVTERYGTPLYRLRTPPSRVGEVLNALAEGLDVAAAVRVVGHGEATITRWRDRAGLQAMRLHERLLRHLHLPHVQVDEIRTRLRQHTHVLWVWLACDPLTKLVPVMHLGPRTQASTHTCIHALRAVLAPGYVPLVTSDGLRLYFYALTAHVGRWVTHGRRGVWQVAPDLLYGQVHKRYRARRLVHVTQRVLCGTWEAVRATLQRLGLRGTVNTAFVERLNLTVRQGVPALARRTWATAQTPARLQLHLEWWRGYYHCVRPHRSLRVACSAPGAVERRRRGRYRAWTPAMAAGLTQRRWTVAELLAMPCGLASG